MAKQMTSFPATNCQNRAPPMPEVTSMTVPSPDPMAVT